MQLNVQSIANGFVFTLAQPSTGSQSVFMGTWEEVTKAFNSITVTKEPPAEGNSSVDLSPSPQ